MNVTKTVNEDYQGKEFIITREFDSPREVVFKAWIEPESLSRWWGPKGFTNPVCEWNVHPGGKIYVVMRAPNGDDYPMGGEFREIKAPEKLVFTSGALDAKGNLMFEFLHTALFAEKDGRTTLTFHSRVLRTTAEANRYIGGFEAGMTQSLERLEAMLADTSNREIVISREFDAPRELVWEAMVNPKHVVHWWGPRGFSTTIEEMDVRPGGVWKHVMKGPDGTRYPNKSVFKEVVKPERIVYSHGGGREHGPGAHFVSSWTFTALDKNRTRLTIRMVFATSSERDFVVKEFGAIEGGKQTLERLSEHLPTMRN